MPLTAGTSGRSVVRGIDSKMAAIRVYCVSFIILFFIPRSYSSDRHTSRTCQEITVPMCKGIGYNTTYMPNQFNHDNQEEAGLEVHQFWPLVEIQCSPDLQFFLCSVYTPICVENYRKPLPACRSVCERAKQGCAPLMKQYGFPWPQRMSCEDLPEFGDPENLCMDFDTSGIQPTTIKPDVTQTPVKDLLPIDRGDNLPRIPDLISKGMTTDLPDFDLSNIVGDDDDIRSLFPIDRQGLCNCECRGPGLVKLEEGSRYYNQVTTGGIPNCAMSCHGAYFSADARKFSVFWIGSWSTLCCISTLLTVLTFCIDMKRFEYPERPITFLSACYLMISIGYIIRIAAGQEAVACDGDVIRYQTTGPALCTIVFLLIYFFSMASSIWWVILSFTWFLAAGLKWGQEAISNYSQYFHLIAWLVPSVKSITVLAMSSVDGDPISGICYVGNQNMTNLRGFVLAPLILYLVLGTLFLLAGFVSLFRIRDAIKQQGHQRTEKLEKLMIRIGVFSVLYTVPATIVIACYFYEQHFREVWDASLACGCSVDSAAVGTTPDYSVFMLKYFMCLVVGITSGFWVWSNKTVGTWRGFCTLICYGASKNRTKYSAAAITYSTATMLSPLPPTGLTDDGSHACSYPPSHV